MCMFTPYIIIGTHMRSVVFVLAFIFASTAFSQNAGERVSGRDGMVVSANAEATRIGVDVLRQGGNAVDAAVAVGFALAVTYPSAGNIGGGCYMVIRMADGREAAIDAREAAPAAAHRDMYLDSLGEVVQGSSLIGPRAAGVPGSVDGLLTALENYGTRARQRVLAPAIDLAENGFAIHARLARHFRLYIQKFTTYPATHEAFTKDHDAYDAGDVWKQPELAHTLKLISAHGRDGFYRGETAEHIVKAMRRDGGIMTHEDLAGYQSIIREPLKGRYREYDILSMPPSSSGGVALLQMLAMLERRVLSFTSGGDANTIHLMVESMRRAFADRAAYLGDPAFFDVPVQRLLSGDYIDSLWSTVSPFATPSSSIDRGIASPREGKETTHYSVVDRWGNAVAVTTTINSSFGSLYIVPGAGFLLNNEMDDFSIRPGVPNQFGLLGGEANAIAPGKRMLSSMTPTIVLQNGRVFMVTGSPGGSQIITTVLQSLLHVVDGKLSIDEAIRWPRIHHQWYPDVMIYEKDGLNRRTIMQLEKMGHTVKPYAPFGRCDALLIDARGMMHGCSDPRGYGAAGVVREK